MDQGSDIITSSRVQTTDSMLPFWIFPELTQPKPAKWQQAGTYFRRGVESGQWVILHAEKYNIPETSLPPPLAKSFREATVLVQQRTKPVQEFFLNLRLVHRRRGQHELAEPAHAIRVHDANRSTDSDRLDNTGEIRGGTRSGGGR